MKSENWRQLDTASLKILYETELKAMTDALLSGADWKDVQDKRRLLVELSKCISKASSSGNPAENATRK
jgi:hypothetical protein